MTLENIRSTAPVKEKSRIRLLLWVPEALLVIGFGGFMVHVCGPLGPLTLAMWFFAPKPGHVQDPEGKVMIG